MMPSLKCNSTFNGATYFAETILKFIISLALQLLFKSVSLTKLSFYFESAKKTGEKFREKLGFQNRCKPHIIHPTGIKTR